MQRGCLGARALGDGAVCVCACVYVCSVGTSTLSSGSSRSRHPFFFGTPSLRSPLPPTSASSASACPSASRRWSSGEASTCKVLRGDPAGRRGWLCRSLPPTLCRPPGDQLRHLHGSVCLPPHPGLCFVPRCRSFLCSDAELLIPGVVVIWGSMRCALASKHRVITRLWLGSVSSANMKGVGGGLFTLLDQWEPSFLSGIPRTQGLQTHKRCKCGCQS